MRSSFERHLGKSSKFRGESCTRSLEGYFEWKRREIQGEFFGTNNNFSWIKGVEWSFGRRMGRSWILREVLWGLGKVIATWLYTDGKFQNYFVGEILYILKYFCAFIYGICYIYCYCTL